MNDSDDALNKLEEIHAQLAKSGIFKGYRSIYAAISGLIAFIAALFYPAFVEFPDSRGFVYYWVIIAFINCSIAGAMILYQYKKSTTTYEKQKIRKVSAQFLPVLVAGGIVTIILTFIEAKAIHLLPGIWSLLFGMGLLAIRPYLPHGLIISTFYYFLAGIFLFFIGLDHIALLPAAMGMGFGIGQLISAGLLYMTVEREDYSPGKEKG
jgi:hypothetical protein